MLSDEREKEIRYHAEFLSRKAADLGGNGDRQASMLFDLLAEIERLRGELEKRPVRASAAEILAFDCRLK